MNDRSWAVNRNDGLSIIARTIVSTWQGLETQDLFDTSKKQEAGNRGKRIVQ